MLPFGNIHFPISHILGDIIVGVNTMYTLCIPLQNNALFSGIKELKTNMAVLFVVAGPSHRHTGWGGHTPPLIN